MSRTLSLGYSPCPNDTFIFYALTHGLIPLPGVRIDERLADVETLNQLALGGVLDLTKVSYHAYGHLRDQYLMLRSGGALGRGCGPLVVAQQPLTMDELRGQRIAIPGRLTTANLLLQLYGSGFEELLVLPFEQVMPAVRRGAALAGVIIHESRFTFHQFGLHQVLDLGAWWESTSGLPIPLGGILARRDLDSALILRLESALTASIDYAFAHRGEPRAYIKSHSQELADEVIDQHIDLYVNDFSRSLGREGEQAVTELLRRAEERGIIPTSPHPLFNH